MGATFAFFEFAPSSGAGMPAACSTTPPTGAKGEVLTFARASNGTCTKTATGGLATTSIANGDLVVLSSNQPRVEYDSAGALGLLAEASRQNSVLRSHEIEDAAWTKGPAIGTITANYATAPDGTLTADRYQYTNTNNDYVLQSFSVGGLAATTAVYLRGTSGSGTLNMCRGGGVGQCVTCSYVSTSWSRCIYAATLAASTNVFFGCETSTLGGACGQTGFDVLVWGFQGELGAYASSYIPTTSAAVTRAVETASVTLSPAMNASTGSHAATITTEWSSGASSPSTAHVLRYDASGQPMYWIAIGTTLRTWDGTNEITNVPTITAGTSLRIWSSYTGSIQSINDGTDTATGAFDGTFGAGPLTTLSLCGGNTSTVDGICSRICVDSSPTRCR
jgi:hypothetical protein